MDIKLFSDAIDALEKVGKALVHLTNVPTEQRQRYVKAVGEAFGLLDSALMLVINRLGDISQITDQNEFLTELARLNNVKEWTAIERDVRLCRNLRLAHAELDTFTLHFMAEIKGADWENVRRLVDQVLEREGQLADFIAASLNDLAARAASARTDQTKYSQAQGAVEQVSNVVKQERRRLIAAELQFLDEAMAA